MLQHKDNIEGLYCLIIGVGQTLYSPWSLPVTENDAYAFEKFIKDSGRNFYPVQDVSILTNSNATRDNILQKIEWLAQETHKNDNQAVYIYFSGHGFKSNDPISPLYFLIPHDAQPDSLQQTSIKASEFIDAIRKIKTERLVVFLDCCHAEGMASAKNVKIQPMSPPSDFIEQLVINKGRAVIASSTTEQFSWISKEFNPKLSVFTACLLEGLHGSAAFPGETTIGLLRLFEYLSYRVYKVAQQIGKVQQPIFECAGVTSNFPISRISGLSKQDIEISQKPKSSNITIQRIIQKIDSRYELLSDAVRSKQANLKALTRSIDPEQIAIFKIRIDEQELEEESLWKEIESLSSQIGD
jgi:hypothetical protein